MKFAHKECMLMEMVKYWKTIVDTLQDGLMVLDPAGNILAVNPAGWSSIPQEISWQSIRRPKK